MDGFTNESNVSNMDSLVSEVMERIDNHEIPLHNVVDWLMSEQGFTENSAEDFVVSVMTMED